MTTDNPFRQSWDSKPPGPMPLLHPPRPIGDPAGPFLKSVFSTCSRCPGFDGPPCADCPECPFEVARQARRQWITSHPPVRITGIRGRRRPWALRNWFRIHDEEISAPTQ